MVKFLSTFLVFTFVFSAIGVIFTSDARADRKGYYDNSQPWEKQCYNCKLPPHRWYYEW